MTATSRPPGSSPSSDPESPLMAAIRCPLCGHEGEGFRRAEGGRRVCPRCGEAFGGSAEKPIDVEARTLWAGSALTVVGVLTLLVSTGWIAANFAFAPPLPQPVPGQNPAAAFGAKVGMLVGQILPPGVGILIGLIGTIGGVQMIRRRTWALAVAGAFAAALPCTCGFPLGLPVGVWALLVLANPAVRSAFR